MTDNEDESRGHEDETHLQTADADTTILERLLLEEQNDTYENDEDSSVSRDGDMNDPQQWQNSSYRGALLLLIVAFLYATLNVSVRMVYNLPDPPSASVLSTTRGWMACLFFLPFLLGQNATINSMSPPKPLWVAAGELAFWNFACQGFFNWGLLMVSSARASFLGQTSVVMTPVIATLAGEKLNCYAVLGCLSSLAGLVFLSMKDTNTSTLVASSGFDIGDWLILGGSFCWSIYVVRTSALAKFYHQAHLQGTKTFFLAILYTIWFLISSMEVETSLWLGWKNVSAWIILAYSALGPGTIADLLQQEGQKILASTQSNLILCLEPVFTTFLARFILDEETSMFEKIGGGFLVLGALVSSR